MVKLIERWATKCLGVAVTIAVVILLFGPAIAQVGDPFPPEVWHDAYDSGYGHDAGYGVALDSQQNVITVGYRVTSNADERHNAYVRKYDRLGNFVCEKEVKGPQSANQVSFDDRFYGVAVDSQDNIIVTGTISGNWYGAEGYHNAMYLNKYDPDCNPVWAQPVIYHEVAFGDSAWQEAHSVVVDPSDNIFPAGRVFGAWDWPPGNILESEWATWKYNPNGALQAGFPVYYNFSQVHYLADLSYDIALDSLGNMIVVGVRGVSGCDGCISNNIDWHVRKYNSSGVLLWEDTYGGTANLYDYAMRVAVDSQNNVVVAGYTNKGTDNTAANQNYDWLVIKYAADGAGGVGQRFWTKTYESAAGRSEIAQAVAIDGNNNIIVGGYVKDAAGNVSGRLALLGKDTGDDIGERIITDPANVVPMRLAYRDGILAIGGYISDPAGTNNNIYTALLQESSGPIAPTNPTNGETFDVCSYFTPPLFQWTLDQAFQKLELWFYTTANSEKPTKVKVKDPTATQLLMTQSTWKKILKLPGLSGGELNWKIVGMNKGQPAVESDVFTMIVAAPQHVEAPFIGPTSKTGLPTLEWGNACATKFKVYFSPDTTFSRKKTLSFTDKNPVDNGEYFSTTLVTGTWNAIRKLVNDEAGLPIYWYVESWDVLKGYQRTEDMQFTLEP